MRLVITRIGEAIEMKKQAIKAILSTLLILCLLYLAVTGALLYFGKTGMVLGVSRNALRSSHFWVAFSTVVLTVVHLMLNFRVFLAELRSVRSGQQSNVRDAHSAQQRDVCHDESGKDRQ